MTAIIRAAMHDEYVRLCERLAARSVLKERIKAKDSKIKTIKIRKAG